MYFNVNNSAQKILNVLNTIYHHQAFIPFINDFRINFTIEMIIVKYCFQNWLRPEGVFFCPFFWDKNWLNYKRKVSIRCCVIRSEGLYNSLWTARTASLDFHSFIISLLYESLNGLILEIPNVLHNVSFSRFT